LQKADDQFSEESKQCEDQISPKLSVSSDSSEKTPNDKGLISTSKAEGNHEIEEELVSNAKMSQI
jgi:hypothetical protein